MITSIKFLGVASFLRSTLTPLFPLLPDIICEQEGSTATEARRVKEDS